MSDNLASFFSMMYKAFVHARRFIGVLFLIGVKHGNLYPPENPHRTASSGLVRLSSVRVSEAPLNNRAVMGA